MWHTNVQNRSSCRPTKRILFRAAAILVGLLPLLLIEGGLALFGIGAPTAESDPFIGFTGSRPLFRLNADQQRYEISPERYLCFCPDSFLAQKPASEYRIFCLGGSTVQGRPYAIETSFARFLEINLQAAVPERTFRVVNCGGISYASYRLAPILEEVLQHDPDLIILYTGHNEFLEDRTYGTLKQRSAMHRGLLQAASRSRIVNSIRSSWFSAPRHAARQEGVANDSRTKLPVEVSARLDHPGGLELYHHDPQWQAAVVDHFEFNLRWMVRRCRDAGVPIWVCNPVENLRNCPPFKSEHTPNLSAEQLAQSLRDRDAARAHYRDNMPLAVKLLRSAQAKDPQHAGIHYDLAKCLESMRLHDEARDAYQRALDTDVCPLRMISPLHERLERVCHDTDTPNIDVAQLFERQSENGIPGGFLLVDHVHPSITGHQMIADRLLQQFAHEGIFAPVPGWLEVRDALRTRQMEQLGPAYYNQAEQRLDGLRRWAAGRVKPLQP